MTPDPKRILLLGKLRKARCLAESARWALLDVKILLDEVETVLSEGTGSHSGDGSAR